MREPGKTAEKNIEVSGSQSAVMNLGDDTSTVEVRKPGSDLAVSIALDSGQGYWLSEEEMVTPKLGAAKNDLEILVFIKPKSEVLA